MPSPPRNPSWWAVLLTMKVALPAPPRYVVVRHSSTLAVSLPPPRSRSTSFTTALHCTAAATTVQPGGAVSGTPASATSYTRYAGDVTVTWSFRPAGSLNFSVDPCSSTRAGAFGGTVVVVVLVLDVVDVDGVVDVDVVLVVVVG